MCTRNSLLLVAALTLSCSVVDESLYQDLPKQDDMENLSTGPALEEECDRNTDSFPLDGSGEPFLLDTRGLRDDVNQQSGLACTGKAARGADGFFSVEMEFGDTWHFHISPDRAFFDETGIPRNPVLYVLDETCDIRNCPRGHDICEDNADEHFTFTSTDSGTTVVHIGVDDRFSGGGVYRFEAIKTVCGNGERQHGKACIKGEEDCDENCRPLLDPENPIETTVSHAEFTSANVVQFADPDSPSASVRGVLAGCEPDFYLVKVPEDGIVEATLLTEDEEDCPDNAPAIVLELFDDELVPILDERTDGENGCPSITSDPLSEGDYFLKLSNVPNDDEEIVSFEYRFLIELKG